MPDLKELVEKRERKPFKKRSYRPWDLTGNGNVSKSTDSPDLITPPITTITEFENQKQHESILFIPSDNKPESNVSQSRAKHEPNVSQSKDKPEPNVSQSRAKLKPFMGQNLRHIVSQTRAKCEPNNEAIDSFSNLVGLQRKLVLFIHETRQTIFNQNTNPLSMDCIADQCKVNKHAARKAIQRLEQKKIIIRTAFKVGRGGWTQYKLSEEIIQEILMFKNQNCEPIVSQTRAKPGTEPKTEPKTKPLSSSSYINNLNINKTTTTADDEKNFLPEEWLKIDTSPLEHIFFSTTQLRQLVDKNIPDVVQESINHFSYEILQEPEKYKKPLNVFMGVLRQGNAWAAPSGYEAPKDRALREYTERKKAENEKRNQFVSELMDLEFPHWQSQLSNQDLERIVPEDVRSSRLVAAKTSVLKNYFREQVLIPRLKTEGLH